LKVETVPMKGLVRENQSEKKRYKYLPNSFIDLVEVFYG